MAHLSLACVSSHVRQSMTALSVSPCLARKLFASSDDTRCPTGIMSAKFSEIEQADSRRRADSKPMDISIRSRGSLVKASSLMIVCRLVRRLAAGSDRESRYIL